MRDICKIYRSKTKTAIMNIVRKESTIWKEDYHMEQKRNPIARLRADYARRGIEISEDLNTIRITVRCVPEEPEGLTDEQMEGLTPEEAKQAQEQELQQDREINWRWFIWHLTNWLQEAGLHEAVYLSNPRYPDVEYRSFSDFADDYWVQCEESESGSGKSGWDETMGVRLDSKVPRKLIVDEDHPYLSVRDGVLFNKDQTELLWYPYGRVEETYTVPDGVTKIGRQAFAGHIHLVAKRNQDGSRAERLWRRVLNNVIDSDGDVGTEYEKRPASVVKYVFNRSLRRVVMPDTVTVIEEQAFEHCIFLESVRLSAALEEIGSGAFNGCKEMREISLPDRLGRLIAEPRYFGRSVGSYEVRFFPDNLERVNFLGVRCRLQPIITGRTWRSRVPYITEPYTPGFFSLMFQSDRDVTIIFEAGNERFSSEDGVIFNKDRTELIYCPRWKSGAYAVPKNVVRIGKNAFSYCDKLTRVSFAGSSVADIEDSAFCGCSSLRDVDLRGVKRIGDKAFSSCGALKRVCLHSVGHIGDRAFSGCKTLAHLELDGVEYIGSRAFSDCPALGPVVSIPESCRRMSSHAFSWPKHMTSDLKTLRVPHDTEVFRQDDAISPKWGGEITPEIVRC